MTFFEWDEIFSVNITEIDEQHQKLVHMINDIGESLLQGRGKDTLPLIVKKMIHYADTHFITEEHFMETYQFPDYKRHKAEHDIFRKKTVELTGRLEKKGSLIASEVLVYLRDWLVQHILKTDKDYVSFFHEKGLR